VFNPCGFTRRVALELDDFPGPIPVADPVKAAQFDGAAAKLVVEVPALGFAWVPHPERAAGLNPAALPKPRLKTADGTTVRNEFFEAEIDPATGGLRSFRDARLRMNRLGMQLVFNPGSKSRCRSVTASAGAALGEVVAEGDILDEHDGVLATFRHRLRAWVGRPALEVRIELDPRHAPTGYPWHAYYGARFGWRDDRAALFRGVNGANAQTGYTRPVSPDYLEARLLAERSFVFTGGLPFIQRHGTRMADVILIPEGEQGRQFELLLAMDREYPMQTAAGWVAPTPVVMTEKGPPPVGPSGWLGHLDLPSLLLTDLRPADPGEGMVRAVAARFVECSGYGGSADLRFARDPARAVAIDGEGNPLQEVALVGGAVPLEFSAGETFRVKVEWA
jgi:alpha-mannosidase